MERHDEQPTAPASIMLAPRVEAVVVEESRMERSWNRTISTSATTAKMVFPPRMRALTSHCSAGPRGSQGSYEPGEVGSAHCGSSTGDGPVCLILADQLRWTSEWGSRVSQYRRHRACNGTVYRRQGRTTCVGEDGTGRTDSRWLGTKIRREEGLPAVLFMDVSTPAGAAARGR